MPDSPDNANETTTAAEEATEHTRNNEPTSGQEENLLSELLYCFASYHAVVTPVSITMILSALCVVYINTEATREEGEAAYASAYEVFDLEEGNSSQNFAASLANVLIIVSGICVMTFIVVLMYKYGCMKFFLGYMVIVTTMLLGYFTSNLFALAIEIYEIRFDKVSFAYLIWNYAVVGVLAIFSNKGIPLFVTQGYLVTSSVVLAWQLSYFGEWTAWTLLVILALYDLYAVLTPYGPLKALANLMSQPGARPPPGLLYEAPLPANVQRPNRSRNEQTATDEEEPSGADVPPEQSEDVDPQQITISNSGVEVSSSALGSTERVPNDEMDSNNSLTVNDTTQVVRREPTQPSVHSNDEGSPVLSPPRSTGARVETTQSRESVESALPVESQANERPDGRTGKVALALAKLYKLQVIDEDGALSQSRRGNAPTQTHYSPEEVRSIEWTPRQLRTEIMAVFPARGGRIVKDEEQRDREGPRYVVYGRSGQLLRQFVVDRQGRVMQVVMRESTEVQKNNSIKLGLGDFIFYSVLVSKAALHSFTAFASCMLVILAGLGATLVLLAVHGKALPALPISIFLGIATFVLTQSFAEPWIQEVLRRPFYV